MMRRKGIKSPANRMTLMLLLMLTAVVFLSACATPQPAAPRDPELTRKSSAARTAFDRGDIRRAADLYLEALMRARETGNAEEIGTQAYNVAMCHLLMGRYERALEFLRQARYEMDRADMNLAALHLVEAEALLALDRPGDVRRAAEMALKEAALPEYRAHAHLLKATLELNDGNRDAARGEYRNARRHAERSPLPVQARVEEMLGRIALAEGNHVEAAITFDRVAELFRRAEYYGDMVEAWIRAGESYEAEGEDAAAGYRYFQAARALYGQNDRVASLRMIERAVDAAERARDPRLAEQTALLFREVSNSVKKSGGRSSK